MHGRMRLVPAHRPTVRFPSTAGGARELEVSGEELLAAA